jgi:type III secretory pathway component EscS
MIERIFQALPTQIDTTITLKYKIIIIIILFLIINNLRASGLITYLDEISINQVGY